MSANTVLTDEQVRNIIEDVAWPNEEVFKFAVEVARAIEQAILRTEQVQALRKDAERYRWLRQGGIKDIAVVRGLDAMDYGSSAVVSTYSEELVAEELDEAIDNAMEKQK